MAALLILQIMEPGDDVGDIVLRHRGALIVQRETVGGHIIEPHLISADVSSLGEHQNTGGHACVGFEHAGGHGDDRLQTVAVHQFLANGLVCRG